MKVKISTLADVKKWINNLPLSELTKPLIYMSNDLCVSGTVSSIEKTRADLLWDGDDDPSQLYTRTQLKTEGVSKAEIDEMDIEIPKGSYLIKF